MPYQCKPLDLEFRDKLIAASAQEPTSTAAARALGLALDRYIVLCRRYRVYSASEQRSGKIPPWDRGIKAVRVEPDAQDEGRADSPVRPALSESV